MLLSILFKTLKTLGQSGDIVNFLSSPSPSSIPPITDEILLLKTSELADRIRRRQLTSEQVVRAFINRMQLVQIYLNAIIDQRYEEAIEDAKAVDEFLKTSQLSEQELAQQKPFLGLPFTAKDSIQITGMNWTAGCLRRKGIVAQEDAPIVKNFRNAGAIPVAVTNVPELLLWFATSNKLYGTTNNPFDLTRSPGGSSGGEAALISTAGTPLSICSDIGGSIRMPAFHCGLFGHKPTHKIINYRGTFPEIKDGLEELFTFGPITRFADDLLPALRVMAGDNFHLFRDIEKPVDLKKLRVFYLDDCNNDMSTSVEPYIRDSIREAAQHFKTKFGVPVERAEFKYFKHIASWYMLLFSSNQEVSTLITENTYKINPFLELCKSIVGQSEFSPCALTVAAAQTAAQTTFSPNYYPQVYEELEQTLKLAREEFNSLLGDDGVFIYVSLPRTAPGHYSSAFDFANVCCPMVMNYLGAPATNVPTGTNEGLPYGIQVAATPFNDRLTLAVAKELESTFGGWIKPCEVNLDGDSSKRGLIVSDEPLSAAGDQSVSSIGSSFEHLNQIDLSTSSETVAAAATTTTTGANQAQDLAA